MKIKLNNLPIYITMHSSMRWHGMIQIIPCEIVTAKLTFSHNPENAWDHIISLLQM